jgi:ABC-type multidrug transport system fused ATPase/permease subunit
MIEYLKEIIFLLGTFKRKLPLMFLFFIVVSLLDLIGVGLIYPFLSVVMDPNYIEQGYIKSFIEFFGLNLEIDKIIIFLGTGLIFTFLIKSIVGVFLNWKIISFSQKQQIRLRSLLMKHYQNMSYSDYLNRNSSDFIYAIQSLTVQYSNGVITILLQLVSEILVVFALLIFLVYKSGPMLIIVIVFFIILIAGYDRFFGIKNRTYGKNANSSAIKIGQGITEGMMGFKEVRLLNKEKYFYDMVRNNAIIYADNNLKQTIVSTSPRFLIEFITITMIIFFIVGPLSMGTDINQVIPMLGVLGLAAMRLMPSMNRISGNLTKLRYNRNAVKRLYNEISNINLDADYKKRSNMVEIASFESIKLVNINFQYNQNSKNILNNISLIIKKGETVGFIGESGSGKTTLIDIIIGLLSPTSGKIYYNEKLTNNVLENWYNQIAYLPQNIFLLDDTIKNNITLEENILDNTKLVKVLKDSKLKELVDSLENGLETHIGERGIQLSGGQRQRIALARALYHDREVLVMDEATSALDTETEKEIIQEIDSLKGKKTILIIAHRLSTLQNCDKIFRLRKGEIEVGTPKEILKKEEKLNGI